jgi:hypothetical protein
MAAAEKAIRDAGKTGVPNARFIVLDPNREYARAFADRGNELRLFRVPPVADGDPMIRLAERDPEDLFKLAFERAFGVAPDAAHLDVFHRARAES